MKVLALITDVDDMPFIRNFLNEHFKIKYVPNCNIDQFYQEMYDANIIFTNPNNSRFALNRDCLAKLNNLETVVTASTGTVHIDLDYCREADIKVICIKDELPVCAEVNIVPINKESIKFHEKMGFKEVSEAYSNSKYGVRYYEKCM